MGADAGDSHPGLTAVTQNGAENSSPRVQVDFVRGPKTMLTLVWALGHISSKTRDGDRAQSRQPHLTLLGGWARGGRREQGQ